MTKFNRYFWQALSGLAAGFIILAILHIIFEKPCTPKLPEGCALICDISLFDEERFTYPN